MSSALPLVPGHRTALLPGRALPSLRASEHRFDIDGLRGVAVLSLLAIHCFPSWARGGFIGVDIFFVLSGYLVTEQWLRAQPSGAALPGFYAARVRRLAPPLCLVLLAHIVFVVLFGLPDEARAVVHPAQVAWSDGMPFDAAASMDPLLHLWHLAVIALFYLLWPLVLLSVMERPAWLGWIIGVSMLASLLASLLFASSSSTGGFFSPAARWWELMAGALLAYLTIYRNSGLAARLRAKFGGLARDPRTTLNLMSVGGVVLLGCAVLLIEQTAEFTGVWSILPVLGTVLLIAAGPTGWFNRVVLSLPALRFYGVVSYPLYLWHWPLLCFPVMLGIPIENDVRVIILLASVVLAALTYELIEKPVRSVALSWRLTLLLSGLLAALSLCGWVITHTDGLRSAHFTSTHDPSSAAASVHGGVIGDA